VVAAQAGKPDIARRFYLRYGKDAYLAVATAAL
jgi:hypothetical protein